MLRCRCARACCDLSLVLWSCIEKISYFFVYPRQLVVYSDIVLAMTESERVFVRASITGKNRSLDLLIPGNTSIFFLEGEYGESVLPFIVS